MKFDTNIVSVVVLTRSCYCKGPVSGGLPLWISSEHIVPAVYSGTYSAEPMNSTNLRAAFAP